MFMDKKVKLLIYFLNYLSKKTNFKEISFEYFKEIANFLGYKSFGENKLLFEFFNENVSPKVKWEEFDLKNYLNTFYDKIYSIYKGKASPNQVFTNQIDSQFKLGTSSRSSNSVDFFEETIHMGFSSPRFLLILVNLTDYELSLYWDAKTYGNCYDAEYSIGELIHLFINMDDDCRNILIKIVTGIGHLKLAEEIKDEISSSSAEKIIELIENYFGDKYIQKIFEEYRMEANNASCNSIIEAFEGHFNSDVYMYDSRTLEISYEFFLNFLKENPNIQTFSDLYGYKFIEDSSHIEDARYDFNVSYSDLNREYYTILDNIYDSMTDDEEIMERIAATKEFIDIMKSLKFEFQDGNYYKDIKNKFKTEKPVITRFKIIPSQIDFDRKKITLYMIKSNEGESGFSPRVTKTYKIPFSEIANYVTIEKLHETIKNKIKKYLL